MAKAPLPLDTDAYLADTTHLTTTAHGAYLLLLIAMWRNKDSRLPDDNVLLAKTVNLTADKWGRFVEKQIRPLLVTVEAAEGRFVTQKRLVAEKGKSQESLQGIIARDESATLSSKKVLVIEKDSQEGSEENKVEKNLLGDLIEPKSKGKRSRLPSDWVLPPAWHSWARQQGLSDEQVLNYGKSFGPHWWSTGELKASWFATWQKWILNEIRWATDRANRNMKQRPNNNGQSFADIAMNGIRHVE